MGKEKTTMFWDNPNYDLSYKQARPGFHLELPDHDQLPLELSYLQGGDLYFEVHIFIMFITFLKAPKQWCFSKNILERFFFFYLSLVLYFFFGLLVSSGCFVCWYFFFQGKITHWNQPE